MDRSLSNNERWHYEEVSKNKPKEGKISFEADRPHVRNLEPEHVKRWNPWRRRRWEGRISKAIKLTVTSTFPNIRIHQVPLYQGHARKSPLEEAQWLQEKLLREAGGAVHVSFSSWAGTQHNHARWLGWKAVSARCTQFVKQRPKLYEDVHPNCNQ
jgi:hypothetical protein